MALVPVEDLPNNLVPSDDLPLELSTNIVPDDDLPENLLASPTDEELLTTQLPEQPSSVARRYIADPALSLTKGIVGLGEAAVGIADIPTMGYAGKATDFISEKVFGGTSKDLQNYLQSLKTPEQLAQEHEVAKAKGFTGTLGALAQNPAAIVDLVGQSVPQMIGGIGVARYAIAKGIPFIASKGGANYIRAAALGEGSIAAGATAEQIRQQTEEGLLTPMQATTALGSGVLTGVFGVLGGKVANKLGVDDFEVLGAKLGTPDLATDQQIKNSLVTGFKAALVESAFEELPQSIQEQIAQNVALGRPWDEGVAESAAEGAVAGFVVAGGITTPRTFNRNREIERLKKEQEIKDKKESIVEDEGEDGEVTEASKEQIKNEEFKSLVDQVASEKATEIDTTPVEVKAFETKLTPEVLKNIGLKPNSKAFKQLRNKNLSDPKVKETFIKLLEDSNATINETVTSNLLEEASLRQQAYEALNAQEKKDVDRKTDKRTDRVSDEISDGTRDAVPPTVEEPDRGRTARGADDARRTNRRKRAQSSALKAGYTQEQLDQFTNIGYEPFESTDEKGNKSIGFRKIEETKVPEVPKTKPLTITTPKVTPKTPEEKGAFETPIVIGGQEQFYNPQTAKVEQRPAQETPPAAPVQPKVTTSTIEDQIDQYINKTKTGVSLNQLAKRLNISPSNTTPLFTAAEQSGRYEVVEDKGIKTLKPRKVDLTTSANQATSDADLKTVLNKLDLNDTNVLSTISEVVKNPNASPSTKTRAADLYNKAYKTAKPEVKKQADTPQTINKKSFLDEFLEIAAEAEQEVIDREIDSYFNEDELYAVNNPTPAEKDVVRATRNATNIKEALEIVKRDFADRISKPAMFIIDRILATPNIQTTLYRVEAIEKTAAMESDPQGFYSPSNNSIVISPELGSIQTIIHEGVHAATSNMIKNNPSLKNRVNEILERARAADTNKQFRIKDEQEFIAEAFSNPRYQNFLASTKTTPLISVFRITGEKVGNLVKDIGYHFGSKTQVESIKKNLTDTKTEETSVSIDPTNFLRLEEPINGAWANPIAVSETLLKQNIVLPKDIQDKINAIARSGESIQRGKNISLTQRDVLNKINKHLKSLGYKGIVYKNLYEGNRNEDSYILFDMQDVKQGKAPTTSVWSDFVNFVRNLFKLGNNISNSLLNDVVAVAPELFQGPVKDVFGRVNPSQANDSLFASDIENNAQREAQADRLVDQSRTKIVKEDPNQPFQTKEDQLEERAKRRKGWRRTLDKGETLFFSFDAALQNAIRRELEKTGDWDAFRKQMTELSLSQTLHHDNVASAYLQDGDIYYDTESLKYFTREGEMSWQRLMEKVKDFAKARGISFEKMEQYAHTYLVSLREESIRANNENLRQRVLVLLRRGDDAGARRLWKDWKFPRMTDREIQKGLDIARAYPEVKEVWEGWNYMRKNLLNFLQEAGLYSETEAKALEDIIAYVPFYRAEQVAAGATPSEYGRGLLTVGEKLFEGSKQPVNNVFDNMERWITYSISRGLKNRSAITLKNAAVEHLPGQVRKLGPNETGAKNNTVTIHENIEINGRQVNVDNKYEFEDPLYVHAFRGIEGFAVKLFPSLVKAAQWVRNSIILQPIFTASQISQDAIGAMGYAGLKNRRSILMLPIDVMTEVVRTATGTSSIRKELKKAGVVGGSEYMSVSAREDAAVRAGLKAGDWRSLMLKPFRALSAASDNVIRQAIYKRILKETGSKAKALEAAFEIINFRRAGSSAVVSSLKEHVPFLGAYLQATNVMYKVFSGRGITADKKSKNLQALFNSLTTAMALTMIYQALAAGDDDYEETDPAIRNRKLIIPGIGFAIPVRSDLFTLIAKVIPENLLNRYKNGTLDDTKMWKSFSDSVKQSLMGPSPVPQAFKGPIGLLTNYDPFTGRPVIGTGLGGIEPEEQKTARTTQLGKLANELTGVSPVGFDFFMSNMTGNLYQMFNMFANPLIADMRGDVLPAEDWRTYARKNIPSSSAFILEEFPLSRLRSDFYELRALTNEAYATWKKKTSLYRDDTANNYYEEKKRLIDLNNAVDRAGAYLGILRLERNRILENKTMSPDYKQQLLRGLDVREKEALAGFIREYEYRKNAGL